MGKKSKTFKGITIMKDKIWGHHLPTPRDFKPRKKLEKGGSTLNRYKEAFFNKITLYIMILSL